MKSALVFIEQHFTKIAIILLIAIFWNTCGDADRATNKRLDALTYQIDSLQHIVATKKDLQIEGLKVEKRMIQSTDRKILDVQRQSAIDRELSELQK